AALEMAQSSGARLLLLRAAYVHALPGRDCTDAEVEAVRVAETYLDEVKARLAAMGATDVETIVWYGPAAVAIIEAAAFHKASLIAMTTPGRTRLERPVLGTVAEAVLPGTPPPILPLR